MKGSIWWHWILLRWIRCQRLWRWLNTAIWLAAGTRRVCHKVFPWSSSNSGSRMIRLWGCKELQKRQMSFFKMRLSEWSLKKCLCRPLQAWHINSTSLNFKTGSSRRLDKTDSQILWCRTTSQTRGPLYQSNMHSLETSICLTNLSFRHRPLQECLSQIWVSILSRQPKFLIHRWIWPNRPRRHISITSMVKKSSRGMWVLDPS